MSVLTSEVESPENIQKYSPYFASMAELTKTLGRYWSRETFGLNVFRVQGNDSNKPRSVAFSFNWTSITQNTNYLFGRAFADGNHSFLWSAVCLTSLMSHLSRFGVTLWHNFWMSFALRSMYFAGLRMMPIVSLTEYFLCRILGRNSRQHLISSAPSVLIV